ncbi:hypothetical protein ZYGM_000448 [Zygosaccharomyces mellis]|uniref:FAD-binding FR-type domain-containing protein n=1 Tax=Zygosaccharomyces mellis TaxID=42258 RepID=A0A4C2E3W1_9SACH|nr:hypothetical protein ZYGM_000448 [Zygosaccharomyces mellis]
MNFNYSLFVHQASNTAGKDSVLNGTATSTRSSAVVNSSKNPAYVKHSRHLRELNLRRGEWWGSGLMGFWALLVLISSIEHLGSRFFPNFSMRCKRIMVRNPMARLWRKYVTIPALFNQKHTNRVMLGGTIPTRFESIVLFAYFVLIMGFCCAMVCGGIMLIQSLPLIRHRFYEIFLYGHIILAVFFLVGIWIHVEPFGDGPFAYSVAAIWCFDRFVRILKMSQFGLRLAHIRSAGSDCLTMTVPATATIKQPTPGSFGYIYFLEGWTFFQSHPFTVIHESNGDIKFLIRVKDGITKQLSNRLLKQPEQDVTTRIAIEGYYGEYKTAYAYDKVVMIGGGNGVVGLYEYVKDIANRKRNETSSVKFIKFYWTIKLWDNIEWLAPELMRLQEFDFVKPIVYVTRSEFRNDNGHESNVDEDNRISSDGSQNELEIEENELKDSNGVLKTETKVKENIVGITNIDKIQSKFSHVEFRTSRPHIPQLLHDDIQNFDPSDNICVLSCAHNAVCDDVRRTISFEVGEPRSGRIDLVELLQIW